MTRTALAAFGVAALLASPAGAATGSAGPFAGVVRQGQVKHHLYDNNPLKQDCVQLATPYTVSLSYAPPTDAVTLTVGTKSVTGSNGGASVSFVSGFCTSFDVVVTGTSVGNTAGYVVTVTRGSAVSS